MLTNYLITNILNLLKSIHILSVILCFNPYSTLLPVFSHISLITNSDLTRDLNALNIRPTQTSLNIRTREYCINKYWEQTKQIWISL